MEEFSFKVELTFLSGECDPYSSLLATDAATRGGILGDIPFSYTLVDLRFETAFLY